MTAGITDGGGAGGGREEDPFRRNHGWIDTLFRDVVKERAGRKWRVATLTERDLLMRDAYAFMALRDCLRDRSDIEYVFVRAWTTIADDPLPPGVDVLFLGRPKPFTIASLAPFVLRLEGNMRGAFRDPSNGTLSNSIWYGQRRFRLHELEDSPEERRRCDVDYGILTFRAEPNGDPQRRVVAIAGLSALGTLGMTLILTNNELRAELLRQVRELARWNEDMRPEEAAEITVRISVGGPERLEEFLNHRRFRFRVVAVAIAGSTAVVRDAAETEVELIPELKGGGTVRLEGAGEARLTPPRFTLIKQLVEAGGRASMDDLCRHLGRNKQLLTKLVHDANASVSKQIHGFEHVRLLRYSKKTNVYILAGARTLR